jgi:hypothetical protein
MSSLAGLPDLFQRGGFTYRTVPDFIDRLPKGLQNAATVVWKCCMRFLASRELDERATDFRFAEDTGWSQSLIQKGLHTLEHPFEIVETKEGPERRELPPLIERQRAHGRRTIIPKPLAGRGTPLVEPSPPAPPLREIQETATTGGPSSSSPVSIPKEVEGPKPTAPPELVARACKLVPEATPDWVDAMVAVYTPEWFERALDQVEERNRKPHAKPVRKRKFVMDILEAWKVEGGPPRKIEAATVPLRPSLARAVEEPEPPFAADQVAELVAACRQAERIPARMARVQLRVAVAKGLIAPELVATMIPPELLERE